MKIGVIHSDPEIIEFFNLILTGEGCDVVSFDAKKLIGNKSPEELINNFLNSNDLEVVFWDIGRPTSFRNNVELLSKITKTNEKRRFIPVVCSEDYAKPYSEMAKEKGLEFPYIANPGDSQELTEFIHFTCNELKKEPGIKDGLPDRNRFRTFQRGKESEP